MLNLDRVGHSSGHINQVPVGSAKVKVRFSFIDWIKSLFASLFSGPNKPAATMDDLKAKNVSKAAPPNNVNKVVGARGRPLATRSQNAAAPTTAAAQGTAAKQTAQVSASVTKKKNNSEQINVIKEAEKVLSQLGKNFEKLDVKDIMKGVQVIEKLQKLPELQDREMKGQLMRVKSELLAKLEQPAKELADSLIRKLIETIRAPAKASDASFLRDVKQFNEIMKACFNYYHLDGLVNQLEQKVKSAK